MNEFLKINWRVHHPSEFEHLTTKFLTEDIIANSNIYKNFDNPITSKRNKSLKSVVNCEQYVPGLQCYQKIFKRSLLKKTEKYHCLLAMEMVQSGKTLESLKPSEQYSMNLYKECQTKILQENANYLEFIKNIWERNKKKPPNIRPGLFTYAHKYWKAKCNKVHEYPQYYQEINVVGLTFDENESIVNYNCISNSLEVGTLARLTIPKLMQQCPLKIATLPPFQTESTTNSRLPVSLDKNILKILETEHVDAVISLSAIQHIIDNTDNQSKWTLPVISKEIMAKNKNGEIVKRKILFIDKALAKQSPKYDDFKNLAYKHLIKTNLCKYEAFTYPTEDIALKSSDIVVENEESGTEMKKNFKKSGKIHYNANYRIWKIESCAQSSELMKNNLKMNDIRLLVRCKLDACEMIEQGVLLPCIVKAKVEQQLQYGANIPSKSELAREWCALFFRPFSNLYRVRINPKLSEVIAVDKCTMQKVNTESIKYYEYKPNLGLGVLQKVLQALINLEPGNYLLKHLAKNGVFVAILRECEKSVKNSYDLYADYESRKVDNVSKPDWLPIDVNYILPSHKTNKQIPATFEGFDKVNRNKATTKIEKKRKKKNFPKDESLKNTWIKVFKIEDVFQKVKDEVICSQQFRPSDYDQTRLLQKILLKKSVPSQMLI